MNILLKLLKLNYHPVPICFAGLGNYSINYYTCEVLGKYEYPTISESCKNNAHIMYGGPVLIKRPVNVYETIFYTICYGGLSNIYFLLEMYKVKKNNLKIKYDNLDSNKCFCGQINQ